MKDIKVTVLMAVHNGGHYLKMAIASVLSQTYKDFQFLIIDDCSTDDSLQCVKELSDDRIITHRNEINLGQTKSLNVGLRLAKGKYIARIDSDDIVFPSWLEKQLIYFERNPECAAVSCKAIAIDGSNKVLRVLNSPLSREGIILKSLIASPINHVGSLMRRRIVLEHDGYDEKLKIAADYDLWTRLIAGGYRLASIKDISVAVRFHGGSISIAGKETYAIEETIKIMYTHINNLTSCDVAESDIRSLWKLIYSVDTLRDMSLADVDKILEKIYRSLKPSLEIDKRFIEKEIKKQRQIILAKRILSLIKSHDVEGVRLTARNFVLQYGIFNIFWVFWIFSWLGINFLRFMQIFHEGALKISAHIKTMGKRRFCLHC